MPYSEKETSDIARSMLGGTRCLVLMFAGFGWLTNAATLTVTNTSDSGNGSLRKAIQDASATNGLDTITFNIAGSPPFTINLLSALPALSEVILDGTTQPAFSGQPLIELNGASAGSGTVGLRLNTSNTVRSLAINRFDADGIRTDGASNVIQGCYIGTDVTGTLARGNGQYGIFVLSTAGNQIGGTTSAHRNVISGGNVTGIYLLNPAATGNVIQGNYIGLNAAGTAALSNLNHGITIFSAPGNIIGGTSAGARNVISGNVGSGVSINNTSASGNVIQGNYFGLAASGATAISNSADGITLNNAANNRIGGPTTAARNVISGNAQTGIFLNGTSAGGNLIEGNFIGTDANGSNALGNAFAGIALQNTASNLIGGTAGTSRNVISGNRQDGIYATNCSDLLIQGNLIGLNVSGLAALPNAITGITLDNSRSNSVGGDLAELGNVISGNASLGLWLQKSNTTGNLVRGNLIGTGLHGTNAIGNNGGGLGFNDAANNQVGGFTTAERNVISGNGFPANNGAIYVSGLAASSNRFFGNYIGTDISGQTALPNAYEGLYILGARGNSIGSAVSGGGNLISGNGTRGVRLTNSSANTMVGNYLGTKADGVSALANGQFNIELEEFSSSNAIGGLNVSSGNRIAFSGGGFAGVRVRDLCTNNAILGNALFFNSGLAVDLGLSAGVTTNDNCDTDGGANQLQNFPILQLAYSGSSLGVRGFLNSRANTTYRLQFFASPACDASGNGEGQTYLGDAMVASGATCSNNFVATFAAAVPVGYVITATATDPANNTSEFSACQGVASTPQLALVSPASTNRVLLSWTNTAPGFVLQETTNLTPVVVWTSVTNVPVISNGNFLVNLARPDGSRFYRLSFE